MINSIYKTDILICKMCICVKRVLEINASVSNPYQFEVLFHELSLYVIYYLTAVFKLESDLPTYGLKRNYR